MRQSSEVRSKISQPKGDIRDGKFGSLTYARSQGRPAILEANLDAEIVDLVAIWKAAKLMPAQPKLSRDSAHLDYARDVINGEIVTNDMVRSVCARQLQLHDAPLAGWEFRWDLMVRFLVFAACAPHVKGVWAERDELLVLQPWQLFLLGEAYGWRRVGDPDERLYQRIVCQVAKKNGKTMMAALIGLYELRYARPKSGAEVYSVATSLEQARLCWNNAVRVAMRIAPGVLDDLHVTTNKMVFGTSSEFTPMSREAKALEGKNPSCAIFDEAALIDDPNIFANLQTAAAGRQGRNVEIYITTAQGRLTSPYTEIRAAIADDIRQEKIDARTLPMLYEMDIEDKPLSDESCWIKANPNLGVTVQPEFLRTITIDAARSQSRRSAILQKHFNVWLGSDMHTWLDLDDWDRCAGAVVSDGPVYMGVDLASVSDLCAVAMLFTPTPNTAHLVIRCWMSRASYDALSTMRRPYFEDGIERGELLVTEGKTTDLNQVEEYIHAMMSQHNVQLVGADPHNAAGLINRIEDKHPDNVLIVRPYRSTMNAGIREMERFVLDGRLIHEGSQFLRWQIANARIDIAPSNELVLLKKPHIDDKIDAVTAASIAFRCRVEPRDIFERFTISFA